MEQVPQEVRQFSKQKSPKERRETAGEIHKTRKEYFDRKAQLKDSIASANSTLQEIDQQVSELRQARISDFSHIGFTIEDYPFRGSLPKTKRALEVAEKWLIQELGLHTQKKEGLQEARQQLKDFYAEEEKKKRTYEEEQRSRDLRNIVDKYNVVFVHGIPYQYNLYTQSLVRPDTNWVTRLKIVLCLNPTLSTSTVEEGAIGRYMWSSLGIILANGSVVEADPSDVRSLTVDLRRKITNINYKNKGKAGNPADEIKRAILLPREANQNRQQNEIIVENPVCAGLYICMDEKGAMQSGLPYAREVSKIASEIGMPFFAIQDGSVYEAKYDNEEGKVILGNKVTPKQILETRFILPPEKRSHFLNDVLAESPFKRIGSLELCSLCSRNEGRELFIELNAAKRPNLLTGKEFVFNLQEHRSSYGDIPPLDGQKVKDLGTIQFLNTSDCFLLTNWGVLRITKYLGRTSIHYTLLKDSIPPSYIVAGTDRYFDRINIGVPLTNNDEYISAMDKSIRDVNKIIEEESKKSGRNEDSEARLLLLLKYRRGFAFHLFGFCEQAREFGDEETARKAFEIARTIVSEDEYQEVIKRRIGPNGKFQITQEDLEQLKCHYFTV